MASRLLLRARVRNLVRGWFEMPAPAPGSREDRKAARLQHDAERWAQREMAAREEQAFERLIESETLRVRLEQRGVVFPEDE
jgi:hypothetical protein